jgi:GTP-binding protein
MNFNKSEFIKSAADPSGFIADGRPQLVFAGRSNVGKSSVINRLTGRKNLARVGSAPGKTSHINYFLIDGSLYFVDLPGYGYAQVSHSEKERWSHLMESYFKAAGLITAGILIVDARHEPTADDVKMAQWFKSSGCRLIIIANKADKLKKNETEESLKRIGEVLELDTETEVMPFSAETGDGRNRLINKIESIGL